jgi:hypothetical protein
LLEEQRTNWITSIWDSAEARDAIWDDPQRAYNEMMSHQIENIKLFSSRQWPS